MFKACTLSLLLFYACELVDILFKCVIRQKDIEHRDTLPNGVSLKASWSIAISIYLPTAITDVDVNYDTGSCIIVIVVSGSELHSEVCCLTLFIWLVANKLKLSVPKSSSMFIGT